jgi:arylsulfatase B
MVLVLAACGGGDGGSDDSTNPDPPATQTPNILFVIADDFGLDASLCHTTIGALKPNMPHLLALCERGLVFDRAWAHPTCTPTRASLLTGQYGIHTNVMQVDDELQPTPTILQRVAEGDGPYATAVIGKWHVGGADPDPNHPSLFGAQYYAGFLAGALTDYFDWTITIDGTSSPQTTYATTVFTDQAIAWVGAQQQPWFLWLAYNAPHAPFHTPPEALYTQAGLKDGTATDSRTKYFAAAEALDHELGRLLASIPQDVLDQTTIVFMGDNGTPQPAVQSPFSATKAKDSLYEGGIRVPLVAAGAGVTRMGQREQALINSTDLFATFAALAQRTEDVPADSVSFAPALSASGFAGRTHAYIDFRQDGEVTTAIRDAQYKLIELQGGVRELYDLAADPFETTDLLASGSTAELDAIVSALVAQRDALQR